MVITSSRFKLGQKVLYKSNERRFTTVVSHLNNNKSNNLNKPNSDNVIGTSNLPNINVQNESPFSTLSILQILTDS